jgi:hypothetical protein
VKSISRTGKRWSSSVSRTSSPDVPQAAKARSIALVSTIAARQEAETSNSIARDWGVEFIAASEPKSVDTDDQAARWSCWLELQDIEARRREDDLKFPRPLLVPVDPAGVRYVRVGWFQAYVHDRDRTISPSQAVIRMLRVDWQRRGTEGRIKATRPNGEGQTNIKFLLVPRGWEDLADDPVAAGNRSTQARA